MTRLSMPTVAFLAIAFCGPGTPTEAQGPITLPNQPVVIDPNAREFVNSCASCHGADGTGAGFLTRVFQGVDPGDLTQLSANNGGTFPLEYVFSIIDGREEVAAHGNRKMPVWGARYMNAETLEHGPDRLNEFRVRNRIYELVHYLQSIQDVGADPED